VHDIAYKNGFGNILVGINFDYWRCLCRRCSANGNAINLNAHIPA